MFSFSKNERGFTLVEIIVAVTVAVTIAASYIGFFNGMMTSTMYFRDTMTAQMLAANKWKELDLVAYASLSAEARAAVGTTGLQREVILGTEVDLGGGNKKRDVTINVYKGAGTTPLYIAPKTVTSAGGSAAAITPRKIVFDTVGTKQWTPPDGVTSVYVTMSAGGGSGSTSNTVYGNSGSGYGSGGGSGGSVLNKKVTVTPGVPVTIVVGDGGDGIGPTGSALNGNNGGNSSFGSLVCTGGKGANSSGVGGSPGAGGTPNGLDGAKPTITSYVDDGNTVYLSGSDGSGASSLFGIGGGKSGLSGMGYGSGGASGKSDSISTYRVASGSGMPGFVQIEW